MSDILVAEHIEKRYAHHLALDDVSISIGKGKVFGLLGPNGAGKTTLIRIINQITAPDKGELYFEGHKMHANDIYRIGYLPEERGLYKKMKVGDQAVYLARLKGLSRHDAVKSLKEWFAKFEIMPWWDKKVEELSKGMAQKVQFIITVLHKPDLLIFDEPFSGFDPINANLLKEEILALRDGGSTVIFSTHNMASVEEICDDIALINKSRKVLDGNMQKIRRQYGDDSYEIAFRGNLDDVKSVLGDDYQIIGDPVIEKSNTPIWVMKIKAMQKYSDNKLLSLLIPKAEVVRFTELIPSMNDVFIKVVKGIQVPIQK